MPFVKLRAPGFAPNVGNQSDRSDLVGSRQAVQVSRDWSDILLFLSAVLLALRAQAVRSKPLPEVIERMERWRFARRDVTADYATRATRRASKRVHRWFGCLDSCLTRSLVAGTLLSRSGTVVLHVGFRSGSTGAWVDGHAWLTYGDQVLELMRATSEHVGQYEKTLDLPFSCDTREERA